MKKCKQILSSVLTLGLILSFIPLSAAAAKAFTDTKGHWAEKVINTAVTRGYINGYENKTFQPNKAVTRAEFCKMLNNALALRGSTTLGFQDVSGADWFYTEVAKSVAAGYIAGYEDNSFRANEKISRQEAAVVIARVVSDAGTQKDLSELRDAAQIDAWARGGAGSVFSKGYMAGDNQKRFNPKGNLTRGEAVKIIEGIMGDENISHSDASLNTANQTVSNTVYTGNLTVYTNGQVTFQNCRILGSLQVQGEGTVRLQNTRVSKLDVNVSTGRAEVIASGTSEINVANLSSGATLTESSVSGGGFQKVNLTGSRLASQDVYLSGSFTQVQIASPARLYQRSGSIKQLAVSSGASGSKIDMAAGTVVERAELNGTADFTGRGVISVAVLNMAGSTFETVPVSMQGKTALIPTITPKNGASDVNPNSDIVLSFNEIPYTSANSVVTTSYVKNSVVELRRASQNGTKLNYDVTLSNNNRVFTIDPDGDFETGVKYFVIIKSALRNSKSEANEYTVFSFTAESGLTPEPYPANGATTIPVSTGMTLNFGEAIYQSNGSTSLSSSYLENTALELRRSSASGTTVRFAATISSDRKTITVTPRDSLDTGTRYYLVVNGGTMANRSGSSVSDHSFYFTTASTDILVPAMTPSPGASRVSVGTDIVLDFDSTIYNNSGGSVSTSYLEDSVFTLRRGSTTGSTTSFDAYVNSNRTSVTLTPSANLQAGTTYYLIIENRALSNGTGSSRKYNEKMTLSFTTAAQSASGTLAPTPTPKLGATGVAVNADITLKFDTAVYQSNSAKSNVTSSYLQNEVIELRSGSASGSHVDFSASITSDRRTVTITPSRNLSNNTRYYVIVLGNRLQDANGNKNSTFTTNFTCGTGTGNLVPTMNPVDGSTGVAPDASIDLNFAEVLYDNNDNQLTSNPASKTYLQKNAIQLRRDSESGSTVPFAVTYVGNSRTITIRPGSALTAGTSYFVVLPANYLRNDSGKNNPRTVLRFTVGSGLSATHTPAANATNVARDASIVLRFNQKLYSVGSGSTALNAGNVNSYMRSNATLTGSGVTAPNFTASINSAGTDITITPDTALQSGRTYTFRLNANLVSSYNGQKNSQITLSFTTNNSVLVPTITPANGATSVSVTPTISLSFLETLYTPRGSALVANDLGSVLELREGSSSGNIVTCTGTVSTDGKTISLVPTKTLLNSTRYYVLLKANSLANSNAGVGQNPAQSYTFNTVAASNIQVTGSTISEVDASGKQTMTLTFSAPVLDADRSVLDQSKILSKLTVAEGQTVITPDEATVSGNTITLSFNNGLKPGTSYTATAAAGVFADAAGNKNLVITQTAASPALSLSLRAKSVGKTDATIELSYNYPGAFTMGVTGGAASWTQNVVSPIEASGTHDWKITGMEEGKTYEVTMSYTLAQGATGSTRSIQFTTVATSKDSSLKELGVEYGGAVESPPTLTANGSHPMLVDKGTVKIVATAKDAKASVEIKIGETVLVGDTVTVGDKPITVTVTVTAENKSTTTYTLVLTGKESTP